MRSDCARRARSSGSDRAARSRASIASSSSGRPRDDRPRRCPPAPGVRRRRPPARAGGPCSAPSSAAETSSATSCASAPVTRLPGVKMLRARRRRMRPLIFSSSGSSEPWRRLSTSSWANIESRSDSSWPCRSGAAASLSSCMKRRRSVFSSEPAVRPVAARLALEVLAELELRRRAAVVVAVHGQRLRARASATVVAGRSRGRRAARRSRRRRRTSRGWRAACRAPPRARPGRPPAARAARRASPPGRSAPRGGAGGRRSR